MEEASKVTTMKEAQRVEEELRKGREVAEWNSRMSCILAFQGVLERRSSPTASESRTYFQGLQGHQFSNHQASVFAYSLTAKVSNGRKGPINTRDELFTWNKRLESRAGCNPTTCHKTTSS